MAAISASDKQTGGSDSSITSLTTPGVTPDGLNTAVWVTVLHAVAGSNVNYWNEGRYTNSSGGLINDYVGADQELSYFNFSEAYAKTRGEVGSATGSSLPIWINIPSPGALSAAVTVVFLSGVNQTTPYGSEVTSTPGAWVPSGAGPHTLTLPFTGLVAGQRVIASLSVFQFGTNTVGTVAATNGNTTILQDAASPNHENRHVRLVTVTGVADGSGNITLSLNVTATSNDDFMNYQFAGVPVNDAAGGSSVAVTFSINETAAHSTALRRATSIRFTRADAETIGGSIRRNRRVATTIAEVEALSVQSLRRSRRLQSAIAESQAFSFSLRRLKAMALSLAEAFNYTLSTRRVAQLAIAIAESEAHSFVSIRRTRNVAQAINEVVAHLIDLSVQGASGVALGFSVSQAEVISETLRLVRRIQANLIEAEVFTTAVGRRRSVQMTVGELEGVAITLGRLKLLAFVSQQTETHSFWIRRARQVNLSLTEVESVVASFNRARAFVLPLAETSQFTLDFGRLRRQMLAITEAHGVSVAMGRLRQLVQSIANTTDLTFTLTAFAENPSSVNVTVEWDEWSAVESTTGSVLRLSHRTEVIAFKTRVTSQPLELDEGRAATVIIPNNAM